MSELSHWLTCHSSSSERHLGTNGRGRGRGWRKTHPHRHTEGGCLPPTHPPLSVLPHRCTRCAFRVSLALLLHSEAGQKLNLLLRPSQLPICICHRIIRYKEAQNEKDNLPFTKASLFKGRGPGQEPVALLFWVLHPALGLKHFALTRERPWMSLVSGWWVITVPRPEHGGRRQTLRIFLQEWHPQRIQFPLWRCVNTALSGKGVLW